MRGERSITACETMINQAAALGLNVCELEPGTLGLGLVVIDSRGTCYRSYVIREAYVNPWVSTHIVRSYRELPKKYANMIDNEE